jgi:hypothetical protein
MFVNNAGKATEAIRLGNDDLLIVDWAGVATLQPLVGTTPAIVITRCASG